MTLLPLLFALAFERVSVKPGAWQCQHYAHRYFSWLEEQSWSQEFPPSLLIFTSTLLPAMIAHIVTQAIPGLLLELIFHTLVLYLCLGSQSLRSTYKCFMQAANRGDAQACHLYTVQMGHCESKPDQTDSFGLRIVWLNYQHYAAVVLWFIAFGAAGAIFYILVREVFEYSCQQGKESLKSARTLRHFADWIPVRIASLGLLLVGNFSRALPHWLQALGQFKQPPMATLTEVARKAEVLPDNQDTELDPALEPSLLIKLAKRNMLFLLSMTAVLTLVT